MFIRPHAIVWNSGVWLHESMLICYMWINLAKDFLAVKEISSLIELLCKLTFTTFHNCFGWMCTAQWFFLVNLMILIKIGPWSHVVWTCYCQRALDAYFNIYVEGRSISVKHGSPNLTCEYQITLCSCFWRSYSWRRLILGGCCFYGIAEFPDLLLDNAVMKSR